MSRSGFDLTSPSLYRAARARGLHVDTWTVNDEASMRRLVSAGVGGIITDRPDLLLRMTGRLPAAP